MIDMKAGKVSSFLCAVALGLTLFGFHSGNVEAPRNLPIGPPMVGLGEGNQTIENGTSNLTGNELIYPGYNFFSLPNASYEEPPSVVNGTLNISLKSTINFDPLIWVPAPFNNMETNYSEESHGHYLIQFTGSPREEWLNDTANLSAEFYGYVPMYAYLVQIENSQHVNISSRNYTRWLGVYHAGYKIDTYLQNMTENETAVPMSVCVYEQSDIYPVTEQLQSLGGYVTHNTTTVISVTINATKVPQIAQIEEVLWIELAPIGANTTLDVSTRIVDVRQQNNGPWTDDGDSIWRFNNIANRFEGITGAGVVVAIADTGIDAGNQDFANRIDAFYDYVYANQPGIAYTDITGHGTHVAGIVAGDSTNDAAFGRRFVGVAPGARLVIQRLPMGFLPQRPVPPVPSPLVLTSDASGQGASILSNSWGYRHFFWNQRAEWGRYFLQGTLFDKAARDANGQMPGEQPLLIIFAAGNSGAWGPSPFPPDPPWSTIQATAVPKNVLTVGASENVHLPAIRPVPPPPYPPLGVLNGDDFADNQDQVAVFSSRGPTDDLRIKPDVVAPGGLVISSLSANRIVFIPGVQNPWCPPPGGWDHLPDYGYCSGTSMATPHVSGAAALITQYYRSYYGFDPSPALVKALLINGAEDMGYGYGQVDLNNDQNLDVIQGDFDCDGIVEFPNTPVLGSYIQGWGRINVPNSIYSRDDRYIWFDDEQQYTFGPPSQGQFTASGETNEYSVTVGGTGDFKVTLVWTDEPATPNTPRGLVNDLDLVVRNIRGTRCYYGNSFRNELQGDNDLSLQRDCGPRTYRWNRDDRNNVENVFLRDPTAGRWTIEVRAHDIVQGPQNYALVISAPRDQIDSFEYTGRPWPFHGWWEYDHPDEGDATTVWDSELGSRVLHTTTTVGYMYGIAYTKRRNEHGSSIDISGRYFALDVKYDGYYYIYAQVMGRNLASTEPYKVWNIRYQPDCCQPTLYASNYVFRCLGDKYEDGNWHAIWRDLDDDLSLSGYEYLYTIAFYVRGQLYLDNLDILDNKNSQLEAEPRRSFGYAPGPYNSEDHTSLKLSEFYIFSAYGSQQNDQINVQFLVQNTGPTNIHVLYFFVYTERFHFGYTGGYDLGQDETYLVVSTRSLDSGFRWHFVPGYSYCPPEYPDCYGVPGQQKWYLWWEAALYLDTCDWDRDAVINDDEWFWIDPGNPANVGRLDPWHHDTDADSKIDSAEDYPMRDVKVQVRVTSVELYLFGDEGGSGDIDMFYIATVGTSYLVTDTYWNFIGPQERRDVNLYYTADVSDTATTVHLMWSLWDQDLGQDDQFDISLSPSFNYEYDINMQLPSVTRWAHGNDDPIAEVWLTIVPSSATPTLQYDRVDVMIGGSYY